MRVSVFEGVGHSLYPKISGRRGRPPPTICTRLDRPVNTLQVTTLPVKVFTQGKFVADFLRENAVYSKKVTLQFAPPWGLEATYAVHRLIGKRVVDFLLVIIELFR